MASRLIETYYLSGINFYIRLVLAWLMGLGMMVGGVTIYRTTNDTFGLYLLLGGVFFVILAIIATWKIATKRTWVEIYNDHLEIQTGTLGTKHYAWNWEEVGVLFDQGKGVYVLQKKEPSEEKIRLEAFYPKEMWYEIVTRSPEIAIDEDVHKRIRHLLETHRWKRPSEE